MDPSVLHRSILVLCGLLLLFTSCSQGQQLGDVQLVGLSTCTQHSSEKCRGGRVEVRDRDNRWATICNTGFDAKDATVICNFLGFDGAQHHIVNIFGGIFGSPTNPTLPPFLTNLECTGTEKRITDCRYTQGYCGHEEDVGLYCLGDIITTTTTPPAPLTTIKTTTTTLPPKIDGCTDDPNVRLVNGQVADGQVQVRESASDDWTVICDSFFDLNDAKVICKSLCYNPDNAIAIVGNQNVKLYGNRSAEFGLKNLLCTGEESSIYSCYQYPGVNTCSYMEYASVSCFPPKPEGSLVPVPDITCSKDLMMKVSLKKADNEGLQPEHLDFTNKSVKIAKCGAVINETEAEVNFYIPMYDCGTVRTYNYSHIIYTNMIEMYIIPSVEITRTELFDIEVYCAFERNGDPLNDLQALPQRPLRYGNEGRPDVQINFYRSNKFRNILEPPQNAPAGTFFLKATIFVGARLVAKDRTLKLVLQQCYATPLPSPESEPKYFLIKDKCPMDASVNFFPITETLFGFSFRGFKFTDDSDHLESLYLHCKCIVCGFDEFYPRCDRTCGTGVDGLNGERRKRDLTNSGDVEEHSGDDASELPYEIDVRAGPLYVLPDEEGKNRNTEASQRTHQEEHLVLEYISSASQRFVCHMMLSSISMIVTACLIY